MHHHVLDKLINFNAADIATDTEFAHLRIQTKYKKTNIITRIALFVTVRARNMVEWGVLHVQQ